MGDDRRVYSDEEFAVILRKASELSAETESPGPSPGGLTLAEMMAAAAQAGFDPALVERAARMLPSGSPSTMSLPERLLGGPLRLTHGSHVPLELDEAGAARLLSAIQIGVGRTGEGHASGLGVVWHSPEDAGEVLRVTARTGPEGTSVAVDLDRRGTVAIMGTVTLIGSFFAWIVGGVLANEIGTAVGVAASMSGLGGLLALERSYWVTSTRRARDRIGGIMDSLGRMLIGSRGQPAPPPVAGVGPTAEPLEDPPSGA